MDYCMYWTHWYENLIFLGSDNQDLSIAGANTENVSALV